MFEKRLRRDGPDDSSAMLECGWEFAGMFMGRVLFEFGGGRVADPPLRVRILETMKNAPTGVPVLLVDSVGWRWRTGRRIRFVAR